MFAANLRQALRGRGALARLEERSGVSRVQLYRYLSGTMPNEVNLQRISDALGVEESTLFQSTEHSSNLESVASPTQLRSRPWNVERSYALKVYYEVPDAPDYVIVAVINVFAFETMTYFVRYTGLAYGGAPVSERSEHIHTGQVLSLGSYTFFQGRRRSSEPEPSLIYLEGTNAGYDAYEGGGLVMTPRGPKSLRLVARRSAKPIAELDARELVGAFTIGDPKVERGLLRLLRGELPVHVAVN